MHINFRIAREKGWASRLCSGGGISPRLIFLSFLLLISILPVAVNARIPSGNIIHRCTICKGLEKPNSARVTSDVIASLYGSRSGRNMSLDTIPDRYADEIYVIAEEMPLFPGCDSLASKAIRQDCSTARLMEFIAAHIVYPAAAHEKGIEGTVVVTFVVEKDGTISGTKVIREIGGGCGEEVLRVVGLMSQMGILWTPGKQRNKPVRLQYNMPFKFKIR